MAEFVTFVEPGKYEIDFKTDNYEEYRTMEEAARTIIDRCATPTAADVPCKTCGDGKQIMTTRKVGGDI